MQLRRLFFRIVAPWLITAAALWAALKGIDWIVFWDHLSTANLKFVALSVICTFMSYPIRAVRWQRLFPSPTLGFVNSLTALIFGFFMNNVLPARAGEFVRAHVGSRLSKASRTLVLATVASERLVDGLTLSILFAAFALRASSEEYSTQLTLVAFGFGLATLMVFAALIFRVRLFSLIEHSNFLSQRRSFKYLFTRARIFLEGLAPLMQARRSVQIGLLSLVIWSIELTAYIAITRAFSGDLSLSQCVLFMVATNFSSLIPAAPGGIGVIEAAATAILVSCGVPREQALTMVICQHAIQYLVVGFGGILALIRLKMLAKIKNEDLLVEEPILSLQK